MSFKKYLPKVFALSLVLLTTFLLTNCWLTDILFPPDETNYETGEVIWIHDSPGADSLYIGNSIALGTDGSIYYAAGNGGYSWIPVRIFAVNKADGSLLWESEQIDNVDMGENRIVVGDDGTIYVLGFHNLYAIDPGTGIFKWIWEVPVNLPNPAGGEYYTYGGIGGLALMDNGDLVFGSVESGVYSRGLYCVDKNGNTKWYNLEINGSAIFSGISVGHNGTIYYVTNLYAPRWDGGIYLVAVNPSSGIEKWTKKIGSLGSASNNIAIADDGFLICSFIDEGATERHIHRIDPVTGNISWSSTSLGGIWEKWIGPDGYIYQTIAPAGEFQGIYRIDPQTGGKGLVYRTIEPTAIDNQGRLVVSFLTEDVPSNSALGVFNSDGILDWSVEVDGMTGKDFLISEDKIIYGITSLKQIVAIKGDAKLASSGWPRDGHDNRNTSNWSK